jgi:1-acyl-sn-glycerol-3-phosphate acyltransferase
VRNWKRLQFPKITVQYGDPIRYEQVAEPTRNQQQAVADEIFDEIKRLYAGLEQLGRRGMLERVREERRALRRAKRKRTAPA